LDSDREDDEKVSVKNPTISHSTSNGRLTEEPALELVRSANQLEVGYASILFEGLSLADLAHVTMLAEVGIIPQDAAQKLMKALLTMHNTPVSNFVFDPAVGDVYKNREFHISKLVPDSVGWLRAGRARRDATNIAYQIVVRQRILLLVESLADLAEVLVDLAEKHLSAIMPDFTYMQHAQPTTLAHYLLGFVFPILRDFERFQACYQRVNMCSGGIGSVNGSRLTFKRERLAELLGFDGVVTHARDAMWQADMPVEIMANIVASVISIDRLGEDFQMWATQEFNLIELADGYCRESVIMPQKKNPYGLAFVRGVAGVLIGQLTAMACVGRTMSGQPDNRIFTYGDVPKSLDLAIQTVDLMTGICRTLSINEKVMASRAAGGYSQATDLAEVIMLESNLSYITAHRLVAEVVSTAAQKGIPGLRISSKMIDIAARRALGYPLKLSVDVLDRALQPQEIIATRVSLGGAALEPMKRMIAESRIAIFERRFWKKQSQKNLSDKESVLLKLAVDLSEGLPVNCNEGV
jgi:argininosuccinate lyase